ncbi:MAG: hypoxanthine phosphoribosyltransferase [Candidatus Cloacimonetes bacterium]|jgi:hypoxanthine phosphoribosyltransferase|nr:hypoxanthine phosphoribosyltransferase [Candidatus Cloacimonadota bacterium]MDD4155562.1 hypoxanthine phosphoribosyltransferase [Candidatus Cloacimonadota bacterium]
MNCNLSAVLFDEGTIQKRIRELGAELSTEYTHKNPILVCILKGAVTFMTDLMRHMTIPLEIDFMSISSYGESTISSGVVKIRKDIDSDIADRHILIIEDIVDSGLSLHYLKEYLIKHKPASVKTCVLLDKPTAHKVPVDIEYKGFEIENEFVVGYGLDYAEKYRNLPYIGILKEEVYI